MKLGTGLQVNTTLTKIDLFGNSIRNEGAALLGHSLKQNRGLSSLDLRWNLISNPGAEELLACLKINTALTHLDLGGNNINNKTCLQAINLALESNSINKRKIKNNTLPNLNLSDSNITPLSPPLTPQVSSTSIVTILPDKQTISGDDNPIVTYISEVDGERDIRHEESNVSTTEDSFFSEGA